jgi:hypothetical protein
MATGKGNGDEEMYAGVFLQFSCWMFACQVFMQVPGPFCWTWIVSKTKLGVWVQKIKHTRPQINWQFLVLRTQHCDSLMHFQDFQGETNYKNMFRPWRSTNFVGIAWLPTSTCWRSVESSTWFPQKPGDAHMAMEATGGLGKYGTWTASRGWF